MRGGVASGHPDVTEAACEILRAGGNAFDAVVAAGFASTVAEPALTSLGGGGFLLARTASGATTLFDFFVDTPGRGRRASEWVPHFLPVTVRFPGCDQIFNTGFGSAAVPGNLRGFLQIHRRLGRLPLAEVIAPAVQLARQGLTVNGLQGYVLQLLTPIMTLTSAGREIFQPNGRYLSKGDHFANPDLACFLETLCDGGEQAFYEGELARHIAADMEQGQGLITVDDLVAYRVIERKPLAVDYHGCRLLTNPPPSFGGSLIVLSLRLLEELLADRPGFGSPAHLIRLVAVMEEVDRHRADGYRVLSELTESELTTSLETVRLACGGTTHVSIYDGEGNVASMTTSNGEGSGYIVPGTGIMLNNMLGEDDLHPDGFHASAPGLRVASMMAPSLLLENGEVRLVVGSGGSKRIRTAILQVITNVVDFGMELAAAIEAPRIHWDGDFVQMEPGFSESTLAAVRRRWQVNPWTVPDVYFGGVHGVSPRGQGAGDPRRGGHAKVLG